jgi:hypothetical protein
MSGTQLTSEMTVKYQQGQEEHHGFLNSSRTDRIRQYKYHRNSIKETHNRRDVRNIKDSNNSTSISRDANSTALHYINISF